MKRKRLNLVTFLRSCKRKWMERTEKKKILGHDKLVCSKRISTANNKRRGCERSTVSKFQHWLGLAWQA